MTHNWIFLTVIAPELLSVQLLIILERQAATQLPRGKYFSPFANLLETSSTVPTTNAISENDMAILDNFLRIKPSSSTMSLETILIRTRNKPSVWLETMSENEKDNILKQAMTFGHTYVTNFREQQKNIQKQIEERLAEKKLQFEENRLNIKLSVSKEITRYGGVWSVDEVDGSISNHN
ncbi:hypothetical protein SNE40_010438 [Patella caerulea]|uniref:Uncharacterized protein n=1 Tax=Patella caerulea TaxID=87958 RepID=A0AAN8PSU3_PATCE